MTAPHPEAMDAAVQRLVQFFETLKPQDVPRLHELYAAEARFKDPFNEVQGLDAITHIFAHMFEALDGPHFIVTERIVQGQQCFLVWDFRFRFKRSTIRKRLTSPPFRQHRSPPRPARAPPPAPRTPAPAANPRASARPGSADARSSRNRLPVR